ncbi:MAG: hypothetical protein IAG13_11625, partial [Deltaproteobacteria bacterium]|nr:hypothetical protein [Nannocystaceae bacterium]
MRSRRRRVLRGLGLALVVLTTVCTYRAATSTAPVVDPGPAPVLPELEIDRIADELGAAIAIPTVSIPSGGDAQTFVRLRELLRARYPKVHATLEL